MKSAGRLRADAARIWKAALRAVDSAAAVSKAVKLEGNRLHVGERKLDLSHAGNLWILGAGKAAASMGQAAEKALERHIAGGFLVTKYGHGLPLKRIDIAEAGHPLPDANSCAAGAAMCSFAENKVRGDDLVLCLFSGGASSLLVSPAPGITFEDKVKCTQLMMEAGADIFQLNAVRKHLSRTKGGGLARMLAPARVESLILSDVVGDDIGTIASGPTAPDPTTFRDCLEILKELELLDRIPVRVRRRLELGGSGRIEETTTADDPAFGKVSATLVGSNAQACTAAAEAAERLGYSAIVLTSRLEGDNAAAARFHMSIALEIAFHGRPVKRPACLISGGETTVALTGKGKGGRNQEFVMHCLRWLEDLPVSCVVASIGTDGTDGPTDAAGAIADNSTLSRSDAIRRGFMQESLRNNDSYQFFKRLGDLIITGPTRTNVMDLHIVMIG